MHKRTVQSGFSFIELMIVFVLIAMLGAFVVPNLFRTKQGAQRKEFLLSLETMLKDAVLRSVIRNEVHQIYFDIEKEVIQLRTQDDKVIDTNLHKRFSEVKDTECKTHIPFLKKFKIKNFFINGNDEVSPSKALQDVLFYIMPDGTSQAIIANLVDENDDAQQDVSFSFTINPFYARMAVYEKFQTP